MDVRDKQHAADLRAWAREERVLDTLRGEPAAPSDDPASQVPVALDAPANRERP